MKLNYVKQVDGIDKGDILLFTLSTCGWCQKTKNLLKQLGVKYSYVDMDMLDEDAENLAFEELRKFTNRTAYPTVVINKENCIIGYDPDKLKDLFS